MIMGNFGKAATMFGIGALGGGALQALEAAGLDTNNPNEMPGDVESLKSYLKQGYLQLNPDKTSQLCSVNCSIWISFRYERSYGFIFRFYTKE
jgi:hypothetical protein